MEDDPTNLDPDCFVVSHAFEGELLYLRFGRAGALEPSRTIGLGATLGALIGRVPRGVEG